MDRTQRTAAIPDASGRTIGTQPYGHPRRRPRAVLPPRLRRHQHARHRRHGRRVHRQRLPSLQGQGVDLPGAARAVPRRSPSGPTSPSTWRSTRARSSTTSRVLAEAAREVLVTWRAHVTLFYVDAVEFDGRHIQRFYAELAARFEQFAEANRERLKLDARMRDGVPAVAGAALRGAGLHLLLLGRAHLRRREAVRAADAGGDADHRRHPAARDAAPDARAGATRLPRPARAAVRPSSRISCSTRCRSPSWSGRGAKPELAARLVAGVPGRSCRPGRAASRTTAPAAASPPLRRPA